MEELKFHLNTKDGPVCGYIEKTAEGTYYRFKGIPYAKPPVGNLRFLVSINVICNLCVVYFYLSDIKISLYFFSRRYPHILGLKK